MICRLCLGDKEKLVKSHIFPIGFFNKIETKGQIQTFSTSGKKGRKLQKAIYDDEIICHDCEHGILMPLDDYAIRVLRDKRGVVETVSQPNKAGKLHIYKDIDKKRLRQFFASILWRVSVSGELELKALTVGAYEETIRRDLFNNGSIEYVDVFVSFLTDPMHNAFFLPYKKTFEPIDKRRDLNNVDGWVLHFPNLQILVSMAERRLPNRLFATLSDNNMAISTSIHPDSEAYSFVAVEREKDESQLNQIITGFIKSQQSKR